MFNHPAVLIILALLALLTVLLVILRGSRFQNSGYGLSSHSRNTLLGKKWIDDHLSELPENVWVAANAKGLIATAPLLGTLLKELQKKRIPITQVSLRHIEVSSDPIAMEGPVSSDGETSIDPPKKPEKKRQSVRVNLDGKAQLGSQWILENIDTLPEDVWVAATDRGIVAHGKDLDLVMQEVKEKGIPQEDVCIHFNDSLPRVGTIIRQENDDLD